MLHSLVSHLIWMILKVGVNWICIVYRVFSKCYTYWYSMNHLFSLFLLHCICFWRCQYLCYSCRVGCPNFHLISQILLELIYAILGGKTMTQKKFQKFLTRFNLPRSSYILLSKIQRKIAEKKHNTNSNFQLHGIAL